MNYPTSAQTFTVGFVKLLSTHPIHIVVWGNFPFNKLSQNLVDFCVHATIDGFLSSMRWMHIQLYTCLC